MNNTNKVPSRDEIDDKYKWRLEDVYTSDEEWQRDFEIISNEINKYDQFIGKVGESADNLYAALKFDDELSTRLNKLYLYADLKSNEDVGNTKYQELAGKVYSLSVNASSKSSYIVPEILEIPDNKLKEYMNSDNGIKLYSFLIEKIAREKDHVLSKEMEKLLADFSEVANAPDEIYNFFNNVDIRFKDIIDKDGNKLVLTQEKYSVYIKSYDRDIRKQAFANMYSAYREHRNTLAAMFNANVKKEVIYSKTRNYNSFLEYALSNDNVPTSVYDNLIETVHKFMPFMHKYMGLRKKLLGLDKLHMYDLSVPIIEYDKTKYTYDEAKKIAKESLIPLGEDYVDILSKGFEEGWIDVYENIGKRTGAFQLGIFGMHPYVLLNYQGTINDIFTLVHEMGHALHTYYTNMVQPSAYAQHPIFVAEVASTCNEALLIKYLLTNCQSKDEKVYLLNYFLEQFKSTLYRQTMFAEFEKITHTLVSNGEILTADRLCEIYHELNVQYFGPDVIIDEDIDMEWARIPHFYTNFYVYKYATGYSAAIALSQKILNEGEEAVTNYKEFLKSGASKDPIDLLKIAGVDMSKSEPIENALKYFNELIDELEEIEKK